MERTALRLDAAASPWRGHPPHPIQQPSGHSAAVSCVQSRAPAPQQDPMLAGAPRDGSLPAPHAPSDDAAHCHEPGLALAHGRHGPRMTAATAGERTITAGRPERRHNTSMHTSPRPRGRRQPRPWVLVMLLGWAAAACVPSGPSGRANAMATAQGQGGRPQSDRNINGSLVTIPTAVPSHPHHTDTRARRQGGNSIVLMSHDPDPITVSNSDFTAAEVPAVTASKQISGF